MRVWTRPDGRRFVLGDPDDDLPDGELHATADEADADRVRALERLGFAVDRRELVLLLPTSVACPAPPPGITAVRADAAADDELRLLDDELRQDVPGTAGWRWTPSGFREETYRSPHFDPTLYLVAMTADGARVGICRVWVRPERPRLGFVGVRRAYRRHGIARALVGDVLATLNARGVSEVRTEVDGANVASRILFEGLGARRIGGSLELRRSG